MNLLTLLMVLLTWLLKGNYSHLGALMDKEELLTHLDYCTNDTELVVRVGEKLYPISQVQHHLRRDGTHEVIISLKGK
jgi:hypothetical protein